MNTDTPRTNELLHDQFRNHEGWQQHPFTALARQLERELLAVTKERDEAKAALAEKTIHANCLWLDKKEVLASWQKADEKNDQLKADLAALRADGARLVKSAENHLELDSAETHRDLRAAIDAAAGFKPSNDGGKQP